MSNGLPPDGAGLPDYSDLDDLGPNPELVEQARQLAKDINVLIEKHKGVVGEVQTDIATMMSLAGTAHNLVQILAGFVQGLQGSYTGGQVATAAAPLNQAMNVLLSALPGGIGSLKTALGSGGSSA